ncbi:MULTISPECIES: pyruvate kinase [Marinimicrobium]|uniref:Pyruvate kinase n=1 Tax=Marinimicrobium koreense TaxID=306545 RepID=A0A3N1NZ92_9GAMM|nr:MULTISPECIES: pyruvate kinase [Marinimicrobium]ROQ19740.1 pyruvate kinase [Marinimicrobium koreense]
MLRRTKIVSTLGPASEAPEMLEKLILAGVNVVRLNFSHGSPEEHKQRAENVRAIAAKHDRFVAVLGDLQGPKIRISRFKDKKIELKLGDKFVLDADLGRDEGDQNQVGIDYKELPGDCKPGDNLLLDDGRVVLEVEKIEGNRVYCVTRIAGPLSNNKGINRQGGGLSAPALTEKDLADIKTAADIDVDYLAVSFPRSADDMNKARELMRAAGGERAGLVAKVERAEAVADDETLDAIIEASDAVMVARGDLGVEIGDESLIGVQKRIIERSRALNKVVITATQMMESMIKNPMPTRAEVFDVANAVLDGTDAVMLSAETAAGDFPEETIKAMVRIILGAEKHPSASQSTYRVEQKFQTIDESIAMASMYTANHLSGVKAIISLTESGATPRLMSRIGSQLPIFAFSGRIDTQRRVALYRGVQPVPFETDSSAPGHQDHMRAIEILKSKGVLSDGDLVIVTNGDSNQLGGTNTMKILRVGEQ